MGKRQALNLCPVGTFVRSPSLSGLRRMRSIIDGLLDAPLCVMNSGWSFEGKVTVEIE